MFLSLFEVFEEDLLIPLVVAIAILAIITITFIFFTFRKSSTVDMLNVVVPDYKSDKKETKEKIVDSSLKRTKKGKLKKENPIIALLKKKQIDQKVRRLYIRAGKYDNTIEDLLAQLVKTLLIGFALSTAVFLAISNPLSYLLMIFFIAFPFINLISDVKERESNFRSDFPYFLKTLSFILANGSNMLIAFKETVDKQQDGVLKEVMGDVLIAQKVNGGDFGSAFSTIIDKVECDETKEFVEIVQTNLEKGVSIADIFSAQSDSIDRFISSKKRKKIKGMSNKVLIPLLIAIVAVVLLFI